MTDGLVVAKTPSPRATRCSLNMAVFDVPSVIDAIRTGPELAGADPPRYAMRPKTVLPWTGMIVPLHERRFAGPP